MGEWIKKILINIAPYGVVEKYHRKKREKEKEERMQEQERKKEEERRKKEEEKRKKEDEKRKKFLQEKSSKKWGTFYAEYHEKEALEDNWILYEASEGTGMIGNPYAIFKAFQKKSEFEDYVHVWVIQDEEEMMLLEKEYQQYENVVFIHYCSKAYAYFLSKSKYLINNSSFPFMFAKKEGQIYLNTWHGIVNAASGYDAEDGRRVSKNMVRNLLISDYIISPNDFMTEVFETSYRLADMFAGRYIQEGNPQNDLTVHTKCEEILHKLRLRGIQLEYGKKVILYAPAGDRNGEADLVVDEKEYIQFYECLSEKINIEEYQVLIRLHPNEYEKLSRKERESGHYISNRIDMGELLSITDILITDDPSVCFGFLAVDKPILFYILESRSCKSGKELDWNREDLPGFYTKDLNMLASEINQIEVCRQKYQEKYDRAKKWANCYDNENISERVIDIVFQGKEHCKLIEAERTGKKKILMFAGGFYMDGVTSAALALLHAIDYQKYDVSVFVTALKSEMQDYNFDKIPEEVRVLLRCNTLSMTEEQKFVYDMTMRNGLEIDPKYQPVQEYLMKREYSRCFGESQFDYLIDFSGYGVYFSWLTLKQCPDAKKLIWQHNDMLQDLTNEKKRSLKNTVTTIDGLLSVYPYYDKIVSASRAVYEVNKKNLETDITKGKFTYCGNLMDEERIERQISVDGNCTINGTRYLRVVNAVMDNGIEEATLIPFETGKEKCIKFVTMGRCMPEKNHRNLILAVKRMIEEGVSCKLYIIGDGQGRKELEMLIEESGLQGKVIITGFVTNPFVIMKECDCFVFPSVYEAQGLAVLEARLVGLPIIVSNYSTVESILLGEQQYLINGTEVDDVYEGLQAYQNGKVPKSYYFSVKDYNQKTYEEFTNLMNENL